jgi:5'-nucleotidase
VLVTQSGYYGQGLTSINLTFNNSGSVQSASAINTPVVNDTSTGLPNDVVPLAANSTIKNAVQEYGSLSNVQGAVPIGWIAGPLTIATPPSGCAPNCDSGVRDKGLESAAGDFMADAFKATIPGAQIVFVNAGGVRATVSSPTNTYPYNLTYANIATMAPFNNVLVSATMTGAQIKAALEQQWNPTIVAADFAPGNVGEILDVNKEFTYTWDASQPYGSRIIASSMLLNGTPINLSSTYTVGMQAFIAGQIINPTAAAPDGFTAFAGSTNLQYYGIDNQALNAYLTSNTTQANPYVPVQPVAGQFRIHKVVGSTDCGYGSSWVVAGTCANADGH